MGKVVDTYSNPAGSVSTSWPVERLEVAIVTVTVSPGATDEGIDLMTLADCAATVAKLSSPTRPTAAVTVINASIFLIKASISLSFV